MSDATDRTAAMLELVRLTQPDAEPFVTQAELDAILDDHKRAARWTASTALTKGARIMPTVRNGYVYEVTTAGTTGGAEPVWGTSLEVTSGTVTMFVAGPDYANVYDVRMAAQEAWALKQAKAAELHEGREEEIFKQCVQMVDYYKTPMIA